MEFQLFWCWIVLQPLRWVWILLTKCSQNLGHGFHIWRSTCYRPHKITNIFIYAPDTHENNSTFLHWRNNICDSCYVVTAPATRSHLGLTEFLTPFTLFGSQHKVTKIPIIFNYMSNTYNNAFIFLFVAITHIQSC